MEELWVGLWLQRTVANVDNVKTNMADQQSEN